MDGILIINKELNWTSNDVVQKVKHILHEKVGHTGTLDPLATGVLPILVGKGTLLSKYLINHDKEYIAEIELGKKTSTGDKEGSIIEEKEVTGKALEESYVRRVLESFKGKQKQTPPMYSAIKVNGKKLYEYAREGKKVDVKPREIEIYDIELLAIIPEKSEIKVKISCSKGTYIRTLSENIAEKLGTVGFMKSLQRTKAGDFDIKDAINISEIENKEILNKNFISFEQFFKLNENIILDDNFLKKFLNGVKINIEKKDGIYKIYDKNDKFIGTGKLNQNGLKRDICCN